MKPCTCMYVRNWSLQLKFTYSLCTLLHMLLLVRLSSQTYRRDYDAKPDRERTENVQVMKDDSMTVRGEDLHARNKAIHFTCWWPMNRISTGDYTHIGSKPSISSLHNFCSAWGTPCVCVYLVSQESTGRIVNLANIQSGNWETLSQSLLDHIMYIGMWLRTHQQWHHFNCVSPQESIPTLSNPQ